MSTELNELLQIRNQKEDKQRRVVQDLSQAIEAKKTMLTTLEQSMTLFNTQKAALENVFFDQINGQEMKPDSLSDYQDKVKQISDFAANLDIQHQTVVAEIQTTETQLNQARLELTTAEQDVEKIGLLVKSENETTRQNKARAEDAQADEQAAEAWGRSS